MKNSNDAKGNQTRDLPTCSALPQPTAPPCTRDIKGRIYFPVHANAAGEGQHNNREGPTLSSIGCLVTEDIHIVSRAKCGTVDLQSLFV